MAERFLKIFQRQWGEMHEAAYLLGFFALLSQVFGLFRDRFLAHAFGASASLDIYYAAFRIPDFIFVSLASLAGAYVLIPFFMEKRKQGKEEAKEFLSQVFTALFFLMAVVSAALFLLLPFLAQYVAPGFSGSEREEFVFLSRLLLISPFLLGLSNLLGSVTQALRRFFLFAISPILYNLGIILGIAFLAPLFGVRGVAMGVLIGAFLHLAIQLPAILGEGLFPHFTKIAFPEVGRVFAISLPRALALSGSHFALLVLVAIASLISPGSVSIFQFSFNLQSAPLSVIGVSYSVAAFPMLVALFGSGDTKKFLEHISSALRHIIFWSIPIIALTVVLRAQIVRTILGTGAFNWEHTRLVAAALAVFVVSLLAQNLCMLFARGYYAAGNTKRPFVINILSAALIMFFGIFFFRLFAENSLFRNFIEQILKIEGLPGAAIVALPLAFTFGMIVNAILFYFFFERDFGRLGTKISRAFFESISASFFMALAAHMSLKIFDDIFNLNTFFGIFSQGLLSGLIGIVVGAGFLLLVKNKEMEDIAQALRHKFWRTKPIASSEQEGL
ncbi:hypothetical protein L0Y69_02175 [bacterium]|nr:hypothetical protein [bacterium]